MSNEAERLINEFTNEYMQKLFYFCLKKTGSVQEAQELTQDVALNVITSLSRGNIPKYFSAWVWKIARNRYSVWANEKRRQNEAVTALDISDYDIKDEQESIVDEMIRNEQLSLLRRELSFISREYSNIVVAYYINGQSIRDISKNLSLSTEAIKKRLQRARKILKEGMNMAREFGKRSYTPEDITFASSGPQPNGLPFSAVRRRIPKNILLQASNNPSTLEELSVELGIALPYMEEEVSILHKATLLKKCDNKYITNFFILDKKCRLDIYNVQNEKAMERSFLFKKLIDDSLTEIRDLGIAGDHIDDNTVRWWLVPTLTDYCSDKALADKNSNPHKRENGESWGFVGYENVNLPKDTVMGHNGTGDEKCMFWTYKIGGDYGLWDQCGEPQFEHAILLGDCIRNNRKVTSFTDSEQRIWKGINGRWAHEGEDGSIIPDVLVVTRENLKRIHEIIEKHESFPLIMQSFIDITLKTEKIFNNYSHKILHEHIWYNIMMETCSLRMIGVHYLVDMEYLKLPEDTSKSTLGMHILLT